MDTTRTDIASQPLVVLRLHPESLLWQSAARAAGEHAPNVIRAVLGGRNRLELSPAEAEAAIDWARNVPGWQSGETTALAAYALDASRPVTPV